jgi:hypothetical protein
MCIGSSSAAEKMPHDQLAVSVLAVLLFSSPCSGQGIQDPSLGLLVQKYREYTCQQIDGAARALASGSDIKSSVPVTKGKRDSQTGAISWPDLAGLDQASAVKFKDQILALEEAAIERQCSIQFEMSRQ